MIKLATYNIQFSLHQEQIQQNVMAMVKDGVALICLQEVVIHRQKDNIVTTLLQKLGHGWRAACHVGTEQTLLGMGNCILWDSKVLKLTRKQNLLLPYSEKLALHEKIFSWLAGGITVPFKRRVIVGYFKYKNKKLRVTNVHLDHNGGIKNRTSQLKYLLNALDQSDNSLSDIICGDFNNFNLRGQNDELESYHKILHEYQDATATIVWSADLHAIDTSTGSRFFQIFIQGLGIHLKRKLDFIWVKNLSFAQSHKMIVPGSDHLPLVTSLFI